MSTQIPRRSPRIAQLGKSRLEDNKENVENAGSLTSRKRKGNSTALSNKRQALDDENEAGRREGMACSTVRPPTVREIEESVASAMPVDDLLALKFGSNKHDYKSRLEERMKYSALLKDRIKAQSAQAEQIIKQAADKVEAVKARIGQIEAETAALKEKEAALREEKAAAEEECNRKRLALESEQANRASVYESLVDVETDLNTAKSEADALTMQIQTNQTAVLAAKAEATRLVERNDTVQEYNRSLQEYNTKLQKDLSGLQEGQVRVSEEHVVAKRNLEGLQSQRLVQDAELDTVKTQIEQTEASLTALKTLNASLSLDESSKMEALAQAKAAADAVFEEVSEYRRTHGKTQEEFNKLEQDKAALTAKMAQDNQRLADMRAEVDLTRSKLETADIESQNKLKQFNVLQSALEQSESEVRELERLKQESESLRRGMRNKMMDMKGTVRVFCRLKPCTEETNVAVVPEPGSDGRLEVAHNGKNLVFGFDRHFGAGVEQSVVFEELSQLMEHTLAGMHSCAVAYGGAGSGKTHTMLGDSTEECAGMMPRALQRLLAAAALKREAGWSMSVKMSLVRTVESRLWDALDSEKALDGTSLEKMHESGTELTDFSEVAEAFSKLGEERRGSHGDHLVMMVTVEGVNGMDKSFGSLAMVDLDFEHMSSFQEVISAISANKPASFSATGLTQLLQSSLGSKGKASMILNVDPSAASAVEALAALRFATKVNSCLLRR